MEARVGDEIAHRGDDAADRRRRAREGPRRDDTRAVIAHLMTDRDAVHDRLTRGEDAVRHPERPQEQLARRLLVGLPADDLDDPAEDGEGAVRVVPDLTQGRELLELDHRVDVAPQRIAPVAKIGEAVAEPAAGVRDEVFHRRALRRVGVLQRE